jgi:RNA polymerase sigma factor (sigma-70 family)
MFLSKDITNNIAKEFIKYRKKSKLNKNTESQFNSFKNYVANFLSPLITSRIYKYKNFNNYADLQQEGFEAILLALKTYQPKRGDFIWWAKKYINTKVSRAANSHSTIKIPIKKAKNNPPIKENQFPFLLDFADPEDYMNKKELSKAVIDAIDSLLEEEKRVILMVYEFKKYNSFTVTDVSKELKITRHECMGLLNRAKKKLRSKLSIFKDECYG